MKSEIKNFLQQKRQQLAENGVELTPDQLLDSLNHINAICQDNNLSLIDLKRFNPIPPKPPYNFLFESQEEAQDFAARVKQIHNVDCEINLIDFRRWGLISK